MNNKFRRILIALLAMVMVVACFAGCSTEETGDDDIVATPKPVPTNLIAQIKLSGYTYYDQSQNLVNYIAAFNQDYPGVEVTIDRDDVTTDSYFAALDEVLQSDNWENAGDVVLLDAARMEKYAQEGKLIDLTSYVGEVLNYDTFKKINPSTDLLPAAYEASLYNGSLYMVATEYNHKFVFLNYSLLEAAGYSFPQDDWTWNELVEMAEAIKKAGLSEKPIAMDYTSYEVWGAFARSRGKDIYDYVGNNGTIKGLQLTDPRVIEGLTELADISNPERGLVECVDACNISAENLSKYAFVIADHEDITLWSEYLNSEACSFSWDYIHFPRWNDANYDENGKYYQAIAANVYGFAVINHGKDDETYTDEFYRACAYLALYSTVTDASKSYCLDGEAVPANKEANAMKFWREYPQAGKNSSVFSNFAETSDFAGYLASFMPTMAENELDIMIAIDGYWKGTTSMLDGLQYLQDNCLASWVKR